MNQTLRALIVDDEALARSRLRTLLGDCKLPAALVEGEAANAAQAVELLRRQAVRQPFRKFARGVLRQPFHADAGVRKISRFEFRPGGQQHEDTPITHPHRQLVQKFDRR